MSLPYTTLITSYKIKMCCISIILFQINIVLPLIFCNTIVIHRCVLQVSHSLILQGPIHKVRLCCLQGYRKWCLDILWKTTANLFMSSGILKHKHSNTRSQYTLSLVKRKQCDVYDCECSYTSMF